MFNPSHGLALLAVLLSLHTGFAARTLVERGMVEPDVASLSEPQHANVTAVALAGVSWSSLWLPLRDAIPVMFAVSCIVYTLWTFGFCGYHKNIDKRLEVIDDHKKEFQKAYDAFTSATIRVLNAVSESSALVAERGFEAKRRHLLNHARRIREHPEMVGASSCASSFWQLITQWSAVFRECSLQPVSAEDEDSELLEGATVERAAELVCERLESMSASSISRQLESFMGPVTHLDVKALEDSVKSGVFPLTLGCGERVIFTLISSSHAGLLLAFFFGLAVTGVEIAMENWWLAAAMSCGSGCLLGDLLRYEKVDRLCRAESEMRKLRLQSCASHRHHEQVGAFYKEVESITHLWLHRTTPQLEIFAELFDVLWSSPSSTDASLLLSVAEKMTEMHGSLGPPCAWHGEAAASVAQLQTIAGTLCLCADFIKGQQAEAKLERLPAIIHHLEKMELPDLSSEAQMAAAAS